GALSSRHIDFAFVDDPTRQTAERFASYQAARDFLEWLRPYPAPPYSVIDYIDPAPSQPDANPELVPTRAEIIAAALAADTERFKERCRQEFKVVNRVTAG